MHSLQVRISRQTVFLQGHRHGFSLCHQYTDRLSRILISAKAPCKARVDFTRLLDCARFARCADIRRQDKLTYALVPNSGPTHQNSVIKNAPGLWERCQWLQTLRGKEPFSRHGGISKRMGDCPLGRASGLGDWGCRFRRSCFPII